MLAIDNEKKRLAIKRKAGASSSALRSLFIAVYPAGRIYLSLYSQPITDPIEANIAMSTGDIIPPFINHRVSGYLCIVNDADIIEVQLSAARRSRVTDSHLHTSRH